MAPVWPGIWGPGGGSIHASTFHLPGRAEERKRKQNPSSLQPFPEQEQLDKIAATVPVTKRNEGRTYHSAACVFPSRHRRRATASPSAEPLPLRTRPRRLLNDHAHPAHRLRPRSLSGRSPAQALLGPRLQD